MGEYKFSNSNLDFNELLDKYKKLNTTYSDIDDIKINIYENCNLLQDLTSVTTGTTFTVLSTNIRLSSFKNNYVIADTQTLDLDQSFYNNNTTLFTTVESETYINNINLTNIIKTHFVYTNPLIYPSKKIIIKINLPKEIVDKDRTGALQIDMNEIKEHFHSLFDTLELDINQYVTGKHGELEATNRTPSGTRGGNGQNAIVNSAGPAINITNNNPSYFKLNIKTNGYVSGGFGASGGNGGDGKINETEFEYSNTINDEAQIFTPVELSANPFNNAKFVSIVSELNVKLTSSGLFDYYYWKNVTHYYWNGLIGNIPMDDIRITGVPIPPTNLEPAEFPEIDVGSFETSTTITKTTKQYIAGTKHQDYTNVWYIKEVYHNYVKTLAIPPTPGNTGSKANYSNNAQNIFDTRIGNNGTANDGTGGTGGTKGNQSGITNISTDANINIY